MGTYNLSAWVLAEWDFKSISCLLHNYNFLALSGSEKVKKEKIEKRTARLRFYSYQMLKEFANGKNPSETEKSQIDTFN